MENWVHETAHYYRQLVQSMAYPGDLGRYKGPKLQNPHPNELPEVFLMPVLTLLDRDSTFHVGGCEGLSTPFAERVVGLTNAERSGVEDADFIFIPAGTSAPSIEAMLLAAKEGTLLDPHLSATVLIDGCIFYEQEQEQVKDLEPLILIGPGIEVSKTVLVSHPHLGHILSARALKTREYPLGIDIILLSHLDEMMVIPRTTTIVASKGD